MSGSIPTSSISFSGIVNTYNNVNSTNLSTTNISLSSFRSKSFSDSTTVPSSGAISLNSHFKGKTWGYPGLYTFSSHTFTNCGKTGASGPTLTECRSSYSPSWTDSTSYFNVTQTGYQLWTVPSTASTAVAPGSVHDEFCCIDIGFAPFKVITGPVTSVSSPCITSNINPS